MRAHPIRAGLLLAIAAVLTACTSGGGDITRKEVLGTWGDLDGVASAHVILTDDGRVAGSDGCNRLMGEWEFDEGIVTFRAVATTRMHCEGVDTSLSQMRTATLDDDGMGFYDENDTLITTLPRGG